MTSPSEHCAQPRQHHRLIVYSLFCHELFFRTDKFSSISDANTKTMITNDFSSRMAWFFLTFWWQATYFAFNFLKCCLNLKYHLFTWWERERSESSQSKMFANKKKRLLLLLFEDFRGEKEKKKLENGLEEKIVF